MPMRSRDASPRGARCWRRRSAKLSAWARRSAGRVAWLSEVCRLAGRSEEAGQHARQALDLARQRKERGYEAHALHQLGVVHAHADPPDVAQAEAYYQQALASSRRIRHAPAAGPLSPGPGHPVRHAPASGSRLAPPWPPPSTLYRAMEMTFWLPQTEAALAQVG